MSAYAPEEVFKLTSKQEKAMEVLASDATHVAIGGGSRSGKTFLLVRSVLVRALKEPNSRHAIFRFRFNSLKAAVILQTLPEVVKKCFPELGSALSMMNKTDWYMTLPNGSEIWFSGLDDKDRTEKILGMEFCTIYFNECSQIPWHSVVLALTRLAQKTKGLRLKAYYDFNPPSKKHWTYLYFIDKVNPENKRPHLNQFDYAYFKINPKDNVENLDPAYLKMLESLPERARNRFMLGMFADDTEGALWTEELLDQNRKLGQHGTLPQWLRVIIAVDPSGCRGEEDFRSDEIGIVVVALGADGHAYLIEDLSGRYSPEEWGNVVASAFERHEADKIVGEQNFGGDMVRSVIHAVDPDLPFGEVHATRGKVVRAEPVSFLYEQHKVHHVGYFPEIEEQLCAMLVSGYTGIRSPDRADALIWAITELFPKMTKKAEEQWVAPRVNSPSRKASRFDRRL